MLNQKKIKEDIKNTNILFFALIHPLALIISNSISAIIIGVNSDKELWTAISIGTAVAIPIIYFLDMLRKRRINQIRDVYNSSDRKAIYAYEKKRNIIVGLISLAFIIGLISNAIQKLSVGNDSASSSGKVDYNNIKTQEELNRYVQENAIDKCEIWQRACANRNETRRLQEQDYVDGIISNFMLIVLPTVVQNNNLPNSYINPAIDYYMLKLKECGYTTSHR